MKQRANCVFCHNEVMYDFDLCGRQADMAVACQPPNGFSHYAQEPLSAQMGRQLVKSFASNPKRSRKNIKRR